MTDRCWIFGFLLLLVAFGAAALRIGNLNRRPFHPDEANQAYKTDHLFDEGSYRYDPTDHHGPTIYYFNLPALWFAGVSSSAETTERNYRVVPLVFGILLVLVAGLFADGIGRKAMLAAAILTAVSPALTFYSRYYIQETLLVCFTGFTMGCGWRYRQTGGPTWIALAGVGLGLMHATKETWIIAGASMMGAWVVSVFWPLQSGPLWSFGKRTPVAHLMLGFAMAAIVAIVFFSSFFTHAAGPWDSICAFWFYISGHADHLPLHHNPWHFYLHRWLWFHDGPGPVWSEAFIAGLALVGAFAGLTGKGLRDEQRGLVEFLTVYTALVIIGYSIISYKTPWCMLTFVHGAVLLAGVGAVVIVRLMPHGALKGLALGLLMAGSVHLGWQAWQLSHNIRYITDPRNPHVYAHTVSDAVRLAERVEELAAFHPQGRNMVIKVIMADNYWPLPWYLRRFDRIGFWLEPPADCDADVIIVGNSAGDAFDARLKGQYQTGMYGLRYGVLVTLYVEQSLWDKFIATRSQPR